MEDVTSKKSKTNSEEKAIVGGIQAIIKKLKDKKKEAETQQLKKLEMEAFLKQQVRKRENPLF